MRFENQIDINMAMDAVFAFVADQRNNPKWNYYVMDVAQERGDGPAVGARYLQTRKSDSQRTAITQLEAGHSLTIESVESAPAFRRHIDFQRIQAGTRLVDSWELMTGYPKLLEVFAVRRIRRAVASNLSILKTLL